MLVSALAALGDRAATRDAARTALERAEAAIGRDRSNGEAMAHGVMALAALGQRERAREWIERALLLEPDHAGMRYNFACALSLYLEDADGALDLLAPVFAGPRAGQYLRGASADPDLDPIRGDPRFQAMLAETESRLANATPASAS
jgi:adenylate cyclase